MKFGKQLDIPVIRRDDVKSDEEYWFYLWLREAMEFGFISDFAYEPKRFLISEDVVVTRKIMKKTKSKYEEAHLFENHGKDGHDQYYTPDYIFTLTKKGKLFFGDNVFWQTCQQQEGNYSMVAVDVKSSYNPFTAGSNSVFWLKQRRMWDNHGIFVHKINPRVWFKRTWAPESMRWMKGRKTPTKTKLGEKTLNTKEYLHKHIWKQNMTPELKL
jgi:hypothetical protein